MSTVAVQNFLDQVGKDEALQADLAKAVEAENDRVAVTELAKSKGYEFTPEELAAEVERRRQEVIQRQEGGELSDEELEAVAGGEVAVTTAIVSAVTASVSASIGSASLTVASASLSYTIIKDNAKW